jgi:signal transduction histidine kinase/ABC-type uncharacterized transport system substrate-binding protein
VRFLRQIIVCLTACLGPAISAAAEPVPHSVLILDQSNPGVPWYTALSTAFRSTLNAGAATPIAIYAENLDLNRFRGAQYENLLLSYTREKYRGIPIGVIVAVGAGALEHALRLRTDVWPAVPIVFAAIDEETAAQLKAPPNVTGTIFRLTLRDSIISARALVPNLKRIALVGDPLDRQPIRRHFMREIPQFAAELEFIDLTGLPMPELKARVAALPNDTAIIYTAINIDGAGVPYVPRDALVAIAEVANRPIVVDAETQIGFGGTGGFVAVADPIGQQSARLALRILDGESLSNIPVTVGDYTKPVFDWRQLKRWGVSENRLPPGSEVRFREFSLWEQYRWQMIAILGIVLFQAGLIGWLLFERHRRRGAEFELRRRLLEVIHLNRTATAGVLSASFAHELNQPLGAILSNAETAEVLITANPIDLGQLKEILSDIRRDDQRAGEIIRHLGGLMKKRNETEFQEFDLNDAVRNAFHLLDPEAMTRGVSLNVSQAEAALPVRADEVHLQQVILNLAMNGMDAMLGCAPGSRKMTLETALAGEAVVEVSVSDSGTGIPNDKLKHVFDTFFTTKPQGTGLGLSIARTIIETYGGTIWAENRLGGGAVFRFTLPLAGAHPA